MSGQKLAALPPDPWSVREVKSSIADTGDTDIDYVVVAADGKPVVWFEVTDEGRALAHAVAAIPELLGAIAISEKAQDELFAHCIGGNVCNSRGKAMNCTTLNNADLSRKLAIRKAEGHR